MKFKRLFEPGKIGTMELKNRVIAAPLEKSYANPDGSVTQQYIDYTTERAKGGVSLIIPESTYIDPRGRGRIRQLGIYDDKLIPGLKRLTSAVHKYGAKVGMEIQFAGRQTSSSITGLQLVAPSPVPCKVLTSEVPRELTIPEIHDLVKKFGEAARRAKKAGFDLIEIHGAHGYIVGQFLSPFSNQRTDDYGGTPEKRMRFPLEVVVEVRQVVGNDFPVAYRISADEYVEGGLTIDDVIPFVRRLEEAGVNLIDVSAGIYESMQWIVQPMSFPPGCLVDLGKKIKKVLTIPVAIAGRINDPEVAEKILEEGNADFISIGRALHADPYFLKKARDEKLEDIRKCPACMKCNDEVGTNLPISCSINPAAGREREFIIKPALEKKSVMIIGGGPAGMEAASVAAYRGHKVTLYEMRDTLGGQIRLASKVSHKRELSEVSKYLSCKVQNAGVKIKLNIEVTPQLVSQIGPDVVVVATGAMPIIPFTPGVNREHVYTAVGVLDEEVSVRGKALIMGGGLVGCETAMFLSKQDIEIIIVEPTDKIGRDMGPGEGWFLLNEIANDPRIEVHTKTTVEEILDESVRIQTEGCYKEISVHSVVTAVGMASNNRLADILNASGVPDVYTIGDCVLPRKMKEAIYEGAVIGRLL